MPDNSENKKTVLPKGVPENHPSIGRDLRDRVDGPSWPAPPDHGGGRMVGAKLELVWGILVSIWVLYSRYGFFSPYFRDPDSARIAFGVGVRLLETAPEQAVSLFNYDKIAGTYILFELLARIFGVEIAGLKEFLPVVCATFMVGIIALNYSIAFMIWGKRVALVSTSLLSISPIMWLTGQYITSLVPAFFFFMLAVWCMVRSYRTHGGRPWVAAAGILFAISICIRADMLLGLLVPICYAHFVDRRGLRRAFIIYGITAVTLGIIWWLIGVDPANLIPAHPHIPNYHKSLVMNFVGMGPFLCIFAFVGFLYRFRTDRRPLPFIFFWIVLFNSFYTGHLYSPRYFIAYYPVVAWLAAFSLIALYSFLVKKINYNIVGRIALMLIFVAGGLSMLFTSFIVRVDDAGKKSTTFQFAEYDLLVRRDGFFPTGSAWYFMQDFKEGKNDCYGWIEEGVQPILEQVRNDDFGNEKPILYYGADSIAFLDYNLLGSDAVLILVHYNVVQWELSNSTSIQSILVPDPYVSYENKRGVHYWNSLQKNYFPRQVLADEFRELLDHDALNKLLADDWAEIPLTSGAGYGYSEIELGSELGIYEHLNSLKDAGTFEVSKWILDHDGDASTGWWPPAPRTHVDLGESAVSEESYTFTLEPNSPYPEKYIAINFLGAAHVPSSDFVRFDILINGEPLTDYPRISGIKGYGISIWDVYKIPYDPDNPTEVELIPVTHTDVIDMIWVDAFDLRPYDYLD